MNSLGYKAASATQEIGLAMYETTIPQGQVELLHASSYMRYLDELGETPWTDHGVVLGTRLSDLSPSLQADLARYEEQGFATDSLDLLEVMAASIRHASTVTIHCACEDKVIPVTVFPHQHAVHCPLPLSELIQGSLATFSVLHVESAKLPSPVEHGDFSSSETFEQHSHLAAWLWALAWHGARTELLPEIAGPAAYRISPSLAWTRLPMDRSLLRTVERLLDNTVNLSELSEWPGMSRERAIRLLNAVYLQAGLIVTRSHREAFSESFWGGLAR